MKRDLIYDVGLHKGYDTEYYLKKGFKVVAFEANPHLIAHCKEKFKDQIHKKNLIIIEGAIVDPDLGNTSQDKTNFYVSSEKDDWGTVLSTNKDYRIRTFNTRFEEIQVRCINFKQTLTQYGIPYYMKIDIEGSDFLCVKALQNFPEKPKFISIEINLSNIKMFIRELSGLVKMGYNEFLIIKQNDVYLQKEPVDSKEGRYSGYQFESGKHSGLFGDDLRYKWLNYRTILLKSTVIYLLKKLYPFKPNLFTRFSGILLKPFLRPFLNERIDYIKYDWYDLHAKGKKWLKMLQNSYITLIKHFYRQKFLLLDLS